MKVKLIAFGFTCLMSGLAVAGDEVQNGGDSIRIVFEEGRINALNRIERILSNLDKLSQASTVDKWLIENIAQLRYDVKMSTHRWVDDLPSGCMQNACACTKRDKSEDIFLSFKSCQMRYVDQEYAGKLLIHESTHHLGVKDENFSDAIAVRLFKKDEDSSTLLNYLSEISESETTLEYLYKESALWQLGVKYRRILPPEFLRSEADKIGYGIGIGYYLYPKYMLEVEVAEYSYGGKYYDSDAVEYELAINQKFSVDFFKYFSLDFSMGISHKLDRFHSERINLAMGYGGSVSWNNGFGISIEESFIASADDSRLYRGTSATEIIKSFDEKATTLGFYWRF